MDNNETLTDNNDDFGDIQSLIDNARPGDSIQLKDTTYYGESLSININKNISIYGSKDSKTVLDANSHSRIISISKNANVYIYGVTFTNAHVTGDGGAILNEGNLTIQNSKFINNKADNAGAAIRSAVHSNLNVYDSVFDSNTALFGTAIDSYQTSSVIVDSTIFINNQAHEGGAIYNRFSNFQLINSTFINNSAARGGGIYNNRGYMIIYKSKFYSNTVTHLGGGVKSWGICEIEDCIIKNNEAQYGGGVYISEYPMIIKNCTIENNHAEEGGGIIADAYGNLTLIDSKINNNHADIGGGIDVSWGYLSVQHCTLNNNTATDKGGGIACVLFEADVDDTTLTNNHANIGGGLYIGKITANFDNCILNYNTAKDGAAVYNIGDAVLNNFKAEYNDASNYGGGAYNDGNLTLKNSNFNSNKAYIGGVLYNNQKLTVNSSSFNNNQANDAAVIYTNDDLLIDNSNFKNNIVEHSLGIIYVIKGSVNISNSVFKLNRGSDEGGSIFNNFGEVIINNSQFISNSALSYGGAIDNSGTLTVIDSLFDSNQAYGSGAIDNGGELNIINSRFTNNKATKNGGAIDNKGTMNVVGSVFKGNSAGGNGGAIIARRGTSVSHSAIYDNQDSQGHAIFNNTWDENSFENNWWGENNPDFTKLLNFNLPENFTWIIMSVENTTPVIQNRNANFIITLNEIISKNNTTSRINSSNILANFDLNVSTQDNGIIISNGAYEGTFSVPKIFTITLGVDGQRFTFKTIFNQFKITENKNIVQDYNGKTTIKVKIIDSYGAVCAKANVVMKISGKSYNVQTDYKGYASKTLALTPGKYTVVVSCDGKSTSNKITIKQVLKAKSATKKKSKKIKYSASLKTSNGKAIVGKVIKFKINGKTYMAKTNKKGKATVQFKKLKVGKYKITVTYLKTSIKTKLKVKKITCKS